MPLITRPLRRAAPRPRVVHAIPAVLAAAVVLAASCSGTLEGALREGGAASLSIQAGLEPRTGALIRGFQALGGGQGAAVLDGPAIARSMAAAPGMAGAALRNTGPAAVEGGLEVADAGALRFVTCAEGRAVITVNRETAPGILALLSPDAVDYLTALMAPVATGEEISRTEYLGLVASLYGRAVADEIAASRARVTLGLPGPVIAVRGGVVVDGPPGGGQAGGGTPSGGQPAVGPPAAGSPAVGRVEFVIPLLDLLTLDRELVYEAEWGGRR